MQAIEEMPSPVWLAASTGQAQAVRELLESGAAGDVAFGGVQAVHVAAIHGFTQVIEAYLDHDPSLVDLPGPDGRAVAHLAAASGQVGVISLLVARCPDVLDRVAADGFTPLELAFAAGSDPVVDVLVEAGWPDPAPKMACGCRPGAC